MQPFNLLRYLKKDFIDYISSKYPFAERGMLAQDTQLREIMSEAGVLFQDPVLQIVRGRKTQQADLSMFHASLQHNMQDFTQPYEHQLKAWHNIQQGVPTVIATGTGSGKSEGFIFPIIDGLLKQNFHNSSNRVGALFLYPMNALVEDQFFRILKYAKGTGIRAGIYNGTFKKPSKSFKERILKKIHDIDADIEPDNVFVDPQKPATVPHILLTNYKMLEYMLLRSDDQGLFKDINLQYLVLDEAHIYTGTLGLEIACLLARLRVHLGEGAANFLPIATSATLLQQPPQSEQPDDNQQLASMRTFFTQLFGVDFPDDKEWLLQDMYKELGVYRSETFAKILPIPEDTIQQELDKKFPEALLGLAKLFFNLDLTGTKDYQQWGKLIYPHIEQLARELPALLFDSEKTTTIKWQDACQKFRAELHGSAAHLEALLTLASHAFESNAKSPSLGLRVHLFTKPEPRIYWSLDKQMLTREPQGNVLDFITCRKCGHQAWGAIYTPTNAGGHTTGELSPLPDFYEDRELDSGQELAIFHHGDDIDDSCFAKQGWSSQAWQIVEGKDGKLSASLSKNSEFIRVCRKDSKKQNAHDSQSCPACGGTSSDKQRAALSTLRSSASTDIGVYGASLLTNMDEPKEQRLLTFCDNRQETAFLAGFLTDRHRRLNIKRAMATFLQGNSNKKWLLFNTDEKSSNRYFDLAARILLSVEKKMYWGEEQLPDNFAIGKKTLIDLIPKDMLEIDWQDRKDSATKEEREYKNWLMDNITLSDEHYQLQSDDETENILATERGKWCLKVFSDVIFIEMTALLSRESSLASAGLAAWGFAGFDSYELFCDYAEHNQQLGLDAKGLFVIADWLLRELINRGLYLDRHTRRHVMRWQQNDKETLKTVISKGLDGKGLSPNAKIYRLLKQYVNKEEHISIWSKSQTWKEFIEKSPLEKYVQLCSDLTLQIKEKQVYITGACDTYRSSKTKKIVAVSRDFPLAGIATGVKDEVWQRHDLPATNYYSSLYQRDFSEETRLIRGREHNGMLKPEHANRVIEDFVAEKINTLVATPTLEMGVDLPDLPIVMHRSVPPDASNYAQRTGRAGRDPKRALLLTHCGYSSHDLVFYEYPEMMVAGEILPPGLPCENVAIIKRHVQGLVLELLAIKRQEFDKVLDFKHWQDLVNLNDLKDKFKRATGDDWGLNDCEPIAWRSILQERESFIAVHVANFIKILHSGLWQEAQDTEGLTRHIKMAAADWAKNFEQECQGYRKIIVSCIAEIDRLRKGLASARTKEINSDRSLIGRAERMAFSYLQGRSEHFTYPITYLCSSGFLPNFDFPGVTTRFIGTTEQYRNEGFTRQDDATMAYERAADLALREFAPEQTIYGRGFVYKIDRYIARAAENNSSDNKKWGVCLAGCTQLTAPDKMQCEFCGGDLVKHGEENFKQPKLIEIQQAQGHQHGVISDKSARREHHFATQAVRRIGALREDECWSLHDDRQIKIKKYLTPKHQIQTVTIICAGGGKENRIEPVFKEKVEGNMFSVKLKISEKDQDKYEPFIPAVFGTGQAITLAIPLGVVLPYLASKDVDDDVFYCTFAEFFIRATHRVLRLRKRNHSLKIILDKINSPTHDDSDKKYEKIDIMLLDTEEGGSGIITLIWDYWDDILGEAKRLVEKNCCDKACYHCVLSYDNQRVHDLIDKSIFAQEDSLFDFLLHKGNNGSRYKQEEVGTESKQTESRIEEVFAKFLQENFRGTVTVQESVSSIQGKEITRPDFVLNAFGGEQVTVYLDGAAWHANYEKMLSDIEKRNLLAMQGRRVLSLPSKLFVPQLQANLLKAIITPLERATSRVTLKTTAGQLPLAGMEQKTLANLQPAQLNNLLAVDRDCLQEHAGNLFSGEALTAFQEAVQVLGKDFLPAAVQDDMLLFAVDGRHVFQDNYRERWAQYLILTSLFATRGYRIISCWLGARKR